MLGMIPSYDGGVIAMTNGNYLVLNSVWIMAVKLMRERSPGKWNGRHWGGFRL